VSNVRKALAASPEISALGVDVLGLSLLAIKPTPETARALEAETREQLLLKADEAIFLRRNAAVEQERAIKENELNTEIAVQQKQRQVRETQMAAEIAVEEQRATLVDHQVENERKEAEARAHGLKSMLEPLKGVDGKRFGSRRAGTHGSTSRWCSANWRRTPRRLVSWYPPDFSSLTKREYAFGRKNTCAFSRASRLSRIPPGWKARRRWERWASEIPPEDGPPAGR
jgi:hypothetical protein